MTPNNLFANLPSHLPEERLDTLRQSDGFLLERIISTGQATPPGEWYDQDRDEWVVLLRGAAVLRFESDDRLVSMRPGDYLHIRAHRRHRVEQTASDQPTVWLALHFDSPNESASQVGR